MSRKTAYTIFLTFLANLTFAHTGYTPEQIERLKTVAQSQAQTTTQATPDQMAAYLEQCFAPYASTVRTRRDGNWFVIESNGMPKHEMMTGIRSWNQQVPLPQNYTGSNAFRIPLVPRAASKPTAAPYIGPIAIAIDGVPIFNPIKQDGRTDTLAAGELDKWGGHAGRADDYHYHIAPAFLAEKAGPGNPVAFAIDGYPIVAENAEKDLNSKTLDRLNGHASQFGPYDYHYHSTKAFPYINAGFRGVVDLDNRPNTRPIRPHTEPIRGATITGFTPINDSAYELTYRYNGGVYKIRYGKSNEGKTVFQFIDKNGKVETQTYEEKPQPHRDKKDPPPRRRR